MKFLILALAMASLTPAISSAFISETFNYSQCENSIGKIEDQISEGYIVTRSLCNNLLVNASTQLAIELSDEAVNYRVDYTPCSDFEDKNITAKQYINVFRSLNLGITDTAGLEVENIVFGLFQIEDSLKFAEVECHTTYLDR